MHGGPVRATRPDSPEALSDAQWIDYLTVTENPLGPVVEKWWHVRGVLFRNRICSSGQKWGLKITD